VAVYNQENQVDNQSLGSESNEAPPESESDPEQPEPDDEPILEPLRRSTRTPKPKQILDPSGGGKSYENVGATHIVIQKKTDNTLEYDTEEARILAMSFAQTYGLIKGLIKFGDKGKQAANEEMK
jgi:hypothetical protein